MHRFYCILLANVLLFSLHAQETKIGQGEYQGVTVTSSSQDGTGERTLMASGYLPNLNSASRFLQQATFGATYEEIEAMSQRSVEDWLDEQMSTSTSWKLEDYIYDLHQARIDSLNHYFPNSDNYPFSFENVRIDDWYFDVAWFQYAMSSDDDLRQRVALALSEIFVISRVSDFDNNAYALANYYDMLLENAFGNYRELLEKITYHPAMGVYLTYMNNSATDTLTDNKIFPDQNYAREIMQLFSIGLHELNLDGTEKVDGQGNPIPTYDNLDIEGLSGVFTGLSWGDGEYFGDRATDYFSYTQPMQFYPFKVQRNRVVPAHEPGQKIFLGYTIPDRDIYIYGEQDITDALDHISNHTNVAPFITRRLIQRLVTSNPSPGYIERVASVFENDGNGNRGNLGAVVRAILTDKEARDCSVATESSFGILREPFLRYIHLLKMMNLTAEGGIYRNRMTRIYNAVEQRPLNSQTVFNFFQPDYQPNGVVQENGLVAPEFQLTNSVTLVEYLNLFHDYLNDGRDVIDYSSYFDDEVFKAEQRPDLDFSFLESMATDEQVPFLIDYLNVTLAHGNMSQYTVDILVDAIRNFDDDEEDKAQLAVFLVMASPDYLINR